MKSVPIIVAFLLVIVAGLTSGYLLSKNSKNQTTNSSTKTSMVKTPTEAGSLDTKTFKDFATGELQTGGINGEGTHHLVRPGGASQTVYLVSSLIDLNADTFLGKKVEVYGQTVKAKSAGWLMDVGYIKLSP